MFNLNALARELKTAQDEARQIAPFTSRIDGFDEAAGYEVARIIHEARLREGRRAIGRKIGFTNRNIWPEYGVYAPIWGYVYDTTVTQLGQPRGSCRIARLAQPRIEPEIVLHFAAAPPLTEDPEALLACIDWVAHGFEIVQSHFPDWKFSAADTIADGGLHGLLLIGPPRRVAELGSDVAARLERFTVELLCGGELRDTGTGANVLDGPLQAIAHLLSVLRASGAPPLAAGEVVTTGTLTRALPIAAGQTWSTRIEGIDLPGLTATFER
jgi:2-oxo-3-hexenedioate decarboxylase